MTYKFDADARYSEHDEWARVEGNTVTVGISDYAQDQLSDVVYVELPEVGAAVTAGDAVAVVESVKAAADIYAPVSGQISAINDSLEDTPELVNDDPFGDAWFFQIEATDLSELESLMDQAAYEAYLETRED